MPTGFTDLDRITHGLNRGNLIIIAGRPGMGKTSFALNVAQHVAIREKQTVGDLLARDEPAGAGAAHPLLGGGRLLRAPALGPPVAEAVGEVHPDRARRSRDAPLFIDDSPNPTLLEVASKARRLKAEKGLALVILDYLQLMQAGGRYENRNLEIAAISRGLKQLAKELDIPVIALSQLSRQPERRGSDHRPQLADLRECGAIEQDADLVAFIYRDEVYNPDDDDEQGARRADHRQAPERRDRHRSSWSSWARRTSFRNLRATWRLRLPSSRSSD